ncbi:MAG: hypothetical protein WBX25_26815 [Rhodomicrobium sp.]
MRGRRGFIGGAGVSDANAREFLPAYVADRGRRLKAAKITVKTNLGEELSFRDADNTSIKGNQWRN